MIFTYGTSQSINSKNTAQKSREKIYCGWFLWLSILWRCVCVLYMSPANMILEASPYFQQLIQNSSDQQKQNHSQPTKKKLYYNNLMRFLFADHKKYIYLLHPYCDVSDTLNSQRTRKLITNQKNKQVIF